MAKSRITIKMRHTGRIYIGMDLTSFLALHRALSCFAVIADTAFLHTAQKLLKSDDCQRLIKAIEAQYKGLVSQLKNDSAPTLNT